jgi:hypothetical protein
VTDRKKAEINLLDYFDCFHRKVSSFEAIKTNYKNEEKAEYYT